MTNILELLKNEKVEWKKLGEIGDIFSGLKGVTAEDFKTGTTKYIPYISVFNNYEITNDSMLATVRINNIDKQNPVQVGDVLFTSSSENKEDAGMTAVVTDNLKENTYLNSFCFIYRFSKDIEVLPSFSKHIFRSIELRKKISNTAQGVTRFNISKERILSIEIPIPSLETQEKIVEILDKFTNYVTELQSRTKQYTYYRDKLLSEDYLNKITKEMEEDRRLRVEKLKNICEFKRGKRLVKNELQEEGDFPVYQNSITPLGYYHEKNFDKDTTFIISAGAAGEIVYSDRDFWAADDVYVLLTREDIMSRYLYYCLMSKQYIIKSKVRKASIPRLSKDDIEKIIIPLPSLSLQNKIVKILDKFQILLADTKGLLPEEIEQRQKQYEYYREKLLTFDVECDSTHARTHIISNVYYNILQEAAGIVGVDIEDKVEWKMLSDISKEKLSYGSGAKAVTYDGETRYIRITDIDDRGQLKQEKVSPSFAEGKYIVRKGDILFARSGATVGKNYIHLESKQAIYGGYLIKFSADVNKVINKYVYYCVNDSRYEKFVFNMKSNASQPNINAQQYSNFQMLLPPLHVQQHVVNVLDKFDILVNDIKEGLPKEIEQRQKQYEYWRECLLNFPKQY